MKCKNCNKPGCPHRTTDGEKECVYSQALGHDPLTFVQMKELQQIQLQHDWEALRHQAAISAMQALINSAERIKETAGIQRTKAYIAQEAIAYADALIEQMKK